MDTVSQTLTPSKLSQLDLLERETASLRQAFTTYLREQLGDCAVQVHEAIVTAEIVNMETGAQISAYNLERIAEARAELRLASASLSE